MNRAAIRYAKALLSLASDNKVAEAVNNDMKRIIDTFAQSVELSQMLQNPTVKASDKKAVLTSVFSNSNVYTNNLIATLILNKRLGLLTETAISYAYLYDQLTGTQIATVTTAVDMTDALKVKVLLKVKELTGKEAELKNIVDESILGGFILRVGDVQYNASISNKLNNLKREFTIN